MLYVICQKADPHRQAIQASLNLFSQVEELFTTLQPIIKALNLSANSCRYYATWVQKAKLSQIRQFPDPNKIYLHLIAFIQHQYYLRQDTFVDILLKCIQTVKNTTAKRLNEADQLSRPERKAAVRHLTKSNRNYRELIDEITEALIKAPYLDKIIAKRMDSIATRNSDFMKKVVKNLDKHSEPLIRILRGLL